jgi:hypothetical protein
MKMKLWTISSACISNYGLSYNIFRSRPIGFFQAIITDIGRTEEGVRNEIAGLDLVDATRNIDEKIPILVVTTPVGVKHRSEELNKLGVDLVTSSAFNLFIRLQQLGFLIIFQEEEPYGH